MADPATTATSEAEKVPVRHYERSISAEFLDPEARTRFFLTSRGSTSFGTEGVFASNYGVWSFEAAASLRFFNGFGATASVPVGHEAPVELQSKSFIGNIAIGFEGGTLIPLSDSRAGDAPKIGLGGALDYYIPLAPLMDPEGDCIGKRPSGCDSVASIRVIRSLEPGKYMAKATGFRVRGHADYSAGIFAAALEVGITPMFSLESSKGGAGWLTVAGRASVWPTELLEPFLEIGGGVQIYGDDRITGPFVVTPGVRFHFLGLSPALYGSLSLETAGVMFAIDLAGVMSYRWRPRVPDKKQDGIDLFNVEERGGSF